MKDLSFFLLKNSLGSKMRRGIRSFCNGDASTSTLNQHKTTPDHGDSSLISSTTLVESPPTLEEMILQLELEEEIARKAKLQEYGEMQRRMSCVNNSDILRSARNALNQYPRFSLDGKDAMYRSSFRNLAPGRKSICCNRGLVRGRCYTDEFDSKLEKKTSSCLPSTLAGESVIWCKPGVVAKLMGLEVMPVPVSCNRSTEKLNSIVNRQNLRRRAQRHEMERRRFVMDMNGSGATQRQGTMASCSKTGRYCVMRPLAVEPANIDGVGWPNRHFL
ncbi:hypothetical protein PVL29_006991 [Vitis rotundifolia]|uniref:DUF3741 domain-containing protein n=1 Tax=Vitis rotundifolia TaxID=103349 RepID=A0AA39A0E5_VITRO|nr:hypothetical protein PVL29_006991 [Vitis rotundifolia]